MPAGIASSVKVTHEEGGLEKVILTNTNGTSAEVHLHGGHVTSWKNEAGEELLFVSKQAIFQPPKAIRGGIPVCFPQFSDFGPLGQHGFARNRMWAVEEIDEKFDGAGANLVLRSSQEDLAAWPHKFELRLGVHLTATGDLVLTSKVKNPGIEDFAFTYALHTYFAVSDISHVDIQGVKGVEYLDNLQQRQRMTDNDDAVTFNQEVDRIYLNTAEELRIADKGKNRTISIKKEGLPDAVVWNPWINKAKSMADFGDEEYHNMVCVEAAAIGEPVTVQPSSEWQSKLILSQS